MLTIWNWILAHGLVAIAAFNLVLMAVKKLLEAVGGTVPTWLSTLIDWLTGNLPHDPAAKP